MHCPHMRQSKTRSLLERSISRSALRNPLGSDATCGGQKVPPSVYASSIWVKKGGKVMASGKVVVAPDGKSRTVTTTGMGPKGKKTHTSAVYDKA